MAERPALLLDTCFCSPLGHSSSEVVERLRAGRSGIVSLGSDEQCPVVPTGALIIPQADFPSAQHLHSRISPRFARALGGFCQALRELMKRWGPVDQVFLIYRKHFYSEWPVGLEPPPGEDELFLGRFLQECGLAELDLARLVLLHSACSSGLVALNAALRQLARQPQRRVLIVGLESELNQERFLAMKKLGALSPETDPSRSCQPFSTVRTGLVPGEVLVAALLGTRPRAQLKPDDILLHAGTASCDASRLTDCLESGEFLRQVLEFACERLGRHPDVLCPHGTSTMLNDQVEGQVLERFFGERGRSVRVAPLKQYVGHTLNSSGLWETVLNVEMLRHNLLPRLLHRDPMETYQWLQFPLPGEERPLSTAIKLAVGFGGINASLALEKVG